MRFLRAVFEGRVAGMIRKSERDKWCISYSGIANGYTCKAGVDYRSFNNEDDLGLLNAIPCFGDHCERCYFYEVLTPEQRAANEKEFRDYCERRNKIRAAIVELHPHGGFGSIKCPCCGGTVRYSVAKYNGHVHATCSTKGCASWME